MSAPWITPSQMSEWTYCNRQWYLAHVRGLRPGREARRRMAAGTRAHEEYGAQIAKASSRQRLSYALLLVAALLIAWLLLSGAAYEPRTAAESAGMFRRYPWAWVALVLGAALLVRIAALRAHRDTGLPDGATVLFGDTGRQKVKILRDPKIRLSGKPDSILGVRGIFWTRLVAAELKTSERRVRIQDWHRIQLIAYVHLLRLTHGFRAARHGYILVTDGEGQRGRPRYKLAETVRLDRSAKEDLLRTAKEIQRARRSNDIARSHDIVSRCAGCGFRTQCEESLAPLH